MNYFPDKVEIFSGTNGVSYVLMLQKKELVVFIIQAIFKKKLTVDLNHETNDSSIQNFKMARRCTIELDYRNPKLIESYADYFIIGGYD